MAENLSPYAERLTAAMERAGNRSGRWLAGRIAEERGIDAENVRRDVRDYLNGSAEPKPERAELIAVILGAPELATVRSMKERQAARRSELEARVADLEGALNRLQGILEGLAALPDRVTALERQAPPRTEQGGR